jgi:hypothetical protein
MHAQIQLKTGKEATAVHRSLGATAALVYWRHTTPIQLKSRTEEDCRFAAGGKIKTLANSTYDTWV